MIIARHQSAVDSSNQSSREQLLVRWPLHPPPYKYETLQCWVERLAAEYGVSLSLFCRQALGITHLEFARAGNNQPDEVLRKLAVGTGVPMQELRDMSLERILYRLMSELERLHREEPEAFAELSNHLASFAA